MLLNRSNLAKDWGGLMLLLKLKSLKLNKLIVLCYDGEPRKKGGPKMKVDPYG